MREWLKHLREEKGKTQQNVAESLGVSQQFYSFIENGDRMPKMTIDTAQRLSEIFDIPLETILQHERG